jgi:hypothetical protein
MTALTAARASISYASSSFQPTTQAFTVLVENELRAKGFNAYTSTSAVDVSAARTELTDQFAEMLSWGNDLSSWSTACKPSTGQDPDPTKAGKDSVRTNSVCADATTMTNIAIAQQMIAGYTTLISSANDGSGNAAMVAILHGKVLSDKLKDGIPTLQIAVAAAGGSTRTNNFFLLDLFYTPKPSYNAGVVATFELRDKDSKLEAAGARNVLYDYTGYAKWKPGKFDPATVKSVDLSKPLSPCTFCTEAH